MTTGRSIGNLLAVVGLMIASVRPDSTLKDVLRYLALGYIAIDMVLRANTGYLRRRPHWTRESWRRYLAACAVPVAALLVLVCMLVALEWRLPIVGAAQSTTRSIWALASVVFLLIGGGGVAAAIEFLFHGDPARQFAWPTWLSRGPGSAA
jgi:hypothetical protein